MAIGGPKPENLYSEGVNDPDDILETMHERSTRKVGATKGHSEPLEYGSRHGEDNEKYANRRDSHIVPARGGDTPDERKLMQQRKPDDRMYMYME